MERLPKDVNVQISEARHRLVKSVINFLRSMKKGGESELKRLPTPEDLLPFFEDFAWAVIQAQYRAPMLEATSIERFNKNFREAIEVVVEEICAKGTLKHSEILGGGTWWRTIDDARRAVDFGWWETEYGDYGPQRLLKPRRQQLKSLLLARVYELQAEFWRTHSTNNLPAPISVAARPTGSRRGATKFPNRARWVQNHLTKRAWSPQTLYENNGPDRATTRRMLAGQNVRPMSIEKLTSALSRANKAAEVTPEDVPHD